VGSTASTTQLHEPGNAARLDSDHLLPLPFPGRPAESSPPTAPDAANSRGVAHLRLISPEPAPRPTARLEAKDTHPEPDNPRADVEAALGLLLMLLIFLGIARADDLRRLTDRATVTIEQRFTALEDVRVGLRTAYAELRWRAGGRP
jgi:hypothetical protein